MLCQHKLRLFCDLQIDQTPAYLAAMRHLIRSYLTLFLVFAITLTAHSAGAAAGMRDAAGQMVICSGSGPVVIYVDADGQPTRAPHDCPDCISAALDVVLPVQHAEHATPEPMRRGEFFVAIRLQSRMPLQAGARSPPVGS